MTKAEPHRRIRGDDASCEESRVRNEFAKDVTTNSP